MLTRRHFAKSVGSSCSGLAIANFVASSSARSHERSTDWLSWRGNNRDGFHQGATWPSSLKNLRKQWSVSLSDSYSGPIVSGDRVFTTESIAKRDESVVALDRTTGEQIWKKRWAGAMNVPPFAKSNGDWIRSTPATDGRKILVGGMRDVLACFDAATGQELWRIDFVGQHGAQLPSFGLVSSPIILDGFAYVHAGGAIRKISMEDGDLVWDSMSDQGGMSGGAFSSAVIASLHGQEQLIAQTRTTLCGLDLTSGRPLWQRNIAAFRGMNILTPTVWGNHVFTSAYGGKAQLLAINPGESWSSEIAWENKAEAYMSSPVVVNNHLYLHLRNQRLCCIDLSSGKETWRTTPFGQYWSLITDGESILALDETGELILFRANSEKFDLLDRSQVSSEPSWAHLAVAGDQLFIRRQRGLDAYQWS